MRMWYGKKERIFTNRRSPHENRGGGEKMKITLPNPPCDSGGGDEMNLTSPTSSNGTLSNSHNIKKMEDLSKILNIHRTKNNERMIIGHLNINHVANKFEPFISLMKDKLDIVLLSETTIDKSFPANQFTLEGYSNPFRRDRNKHGGDLL